MENIAQFIGSLGGLHDSKLVAMHWDAGNSRLEIQINDLYANFRGLPEYKGRTEAAFIFSAVTKFNPNIDMSIKGIMIYDWLFHRTDEANLACEITFSPAEKIVVECGRIECTKG